MFRLRVFWGICVCRMGVSVCVTLGQFRVNLKKNHDLGEFHLVNVPFFRLGQPQIVK